MEPPPSHSPPAEIQGSKRRRTTQQNFGDLFTSEVTQSILRGVKNNVPGTNEESTIYHSKFRVASTHPPSVGLVPPQTS